MAESRIIRLISNGDKRSVAGVGQAVSLISKNPELISDLLMAINPSKEALNMRALDAIEKATRSNFDLLQPYKKLLLDDLLYQQQKEIRWHVAQIIPRLRLTMKERKQVASIFIDDYLKDESSIVKTNTLQALTELAISDSELSFEVQPIIKQAIYSGTPAMVTRCKKLLIKLKKGGEFQCEKVHNKFNSYPENIKPKLLFLRELIFKVASHTTGVGEIEETLKWEEPSYVTSQTKSGSTVRIDWKKGTPDNYYIYFNCKTTLVDTFKQIYGDLFIYDANRSIIFQKDEPLPIDELSDCIAIALTYKLNKKRR